MDFLAYWARKYLLPEWRTEQATRQRPPQILNLIAWPDHPPSLGEDELEHMRGILDSGQISPPDALPSTEPATSEFGKYIRARWSPALYWEARQAGKSGEFPGCLAFAPVHLHPRMEADPAKR
jgi:hypothetical protein